MNSWDSSEAFEIVGCLNIVNINFFCLSIRIDNFGGFDLFNWGFSNNRLLCNDLTNLGRIIEGDFILIGILNIFINDSPRSSLGLSQDLVTSSDSDSVSADLSHSITFFAFSFNVPLSSLETYFLDGLDSPHSTICSSSTMSKSYKA